MDWTERPISLDGPAAALISAGMKAVAKADGDVHPREMELIRAFQEDLPDMEIPDPKKALGTQDLRSAYVRSLVMVALADGTISNEEDRVIRELCASLDISDAEIAVATREVKLWFLQRFSGVTVFRDVVVSIAEELGVDPSDV